MFYSQKNKKIDKENWDLLHKLFLTIQYTVLARIEPQSWLDPHPTKILIEPQSKRDIEIIEPHLELTPTQGTNTYAILLEMGKTWQFSEEIMMFYLSKNWTSWNYFYIKNIGVVFPSWTVCICFFMLNPLGNVVGQRVHVNMTRFVTCYNALQLLRSP